jgi:hypothetical protein
MGDMYKDILVRSDKDGYFESNSHVIGSYNRCGTISKNRINKSVLVSLQFTEDHTPEQNNRLFTELNMVIDQHQDFIFYLRNHPRFNNEVDVSILFRKSNTRDSPLELCDCFNICSLHLTSYSTTTFESANFGIPTVFLKSLQSEFNMFQTEFSYPLELDLEEVLLDYDAYSSTVRDWALLYYSRFDKVKFISLLQ